MRADKRTAKFRKRKLNWNDPAQVAQYMRDYSKAYDRKKARTRRPFDTQEYWRRYQEKHREAIAAYQKAYRQQHKKYLQMQHNMRRRLDAEKTNAANRRYRQKHPERAKAWKLKSQYGLTPEQLQAMGSRCHICGVEFSGRGKRQRCIDHCHASNRVRGVLCSRCNFALGLLDDLPGRFRAAAEYLEKQQSADHAAA